MGAPQRRLGRHFGLIAAVAALAVGWLLVDGRESTPTVPAPPDAGIGADAGCQVSGNETVTVPDVIGSPLQEAVATVRASGLAVVGTGVFRDDAVGSGARVRAQEPPAGVPVPVGACIGFRTSN